MGLGRDDTLLGAGFRRCVVGAGRIGTRTGALCSALGMQVLGCVEQPSAERSDELHQSGISLRDFESLVRESDVLSVHTPLKDSTRGMIDSTVIANMKPGAVLINTSRGGVVDEKAVFDSLVRGHLSAAAFDVHEREGDGVLPDLASLPNVVLTPHIGGMTVETQNKIGIRVAEIVEAFLAERLDDVLSPDERVV